MEVRQEEGARSALRRSRGSLCSIRNILRELRGSERQDENLKKRVTTTQRTDWRSVRWTQTHVVTAAAQREVLMQDTEVGGLRDEAVT